MSLSDDYLGSIMLAAFNFAPNGYELCNGQSLPISSNTALFALIGTTYGGDGITSFNLPNFQGAVPLGTQGSSTYVLGEKGGTDTVTLTQSNLPAHTHAVASLTIGAKTGTASDVNSPTNAYFGTASTSTDRFGPVPDEHMIASSFGSMTAGGTYVTSYNGSGLPYSKVMPFTGIYYCIALEGVYPSS
jgi:microcystin-dependent protein